MSEDRIHLLNKINDLIKKQTIELLERISNVQEIDNYELIQFYSDWNENEYNSGIKYELSTTQSMDW